MRRLVLWSITGSVLLAAALASATTIHVPPGPGTPVQDAIDAAAPNDTIRLSVGKYAERLVINKPLKLRGAGSTAVYLSSTTYFDPGCDSDPMLRITADGVTVRGIAFVGSQGGGVDLVGRTNIRLQDLFIASNCPSVDAPAVNVDTCTKVTLDRVWAAGSQASTSPAGIRVANAPAKGRIRLRGSIAGYHDEGFLFENDGDGAVGESGGYVNFNVHGIVLRNTTGATVSHNHEIIDNSATGISIDATSTGNRIVGNRISGSVLDVSDAGSGNCWNDDVYTTGSVPSACH